jgi:hypothetical protein
MNEPSANPVWVGLLCIVRCFIPLLALLAISYVIKKLGLVAEPPAPPPEDSKGAEKSNEGGFAHGSA